MTPDLINGCFEFFGALLLLLNVRQLLRDRVVAGVHWGPTVFFTVWGLWNLFFYPHLGQWWSFIGALAIVAVNTTWVALVIVFRRRRSDGRL